MLLDKVLSQLQAYGLLVDTLDTSGKLTHVKVEGNTGSKKSGWYVCFHKTLTSGREWFTGAFGNYRFSDDKQLIRCESEGLTPEERAKMQSDREQLRESQKKQEAILRQQAAERGQKIWAGLSEGGRSEYLNRKKVRPIGVRFAKGGAVAVPVRRITDDVLVGLQFIQPNGSKKFLMGTPKKCACHLMGDWGSNPSPDISPPAVVVEGYATGASVHMATGWPVAVLFDSGNLVSSLPILKKRFPFHLFLVAGDDDRKTKDNPGLKAARTAAASIRCPFTLPQFQAVG